MKRRSNGPSVTRLVRTYPYGTDPSLPGPAGKPPVTIDTMRFGVVTGEGGQFHNGGMVTGAAGVTPASGQFTVADNDFSTGVAVLVLGDYRIMAGVDFVPGVGVNATATAVAEAISRLTGFAATANVAVVSVTWEGPIDEVEFYALHYGNKTNFTTFVPSNGYFGMGRPMITAPVVTV